MRSVYLDSGATRMAQRIAVSRMMIRERRTDAGGACHVETAISDSGRHSNLLKVFGKHTHEVGL
jgi:hypothetical protein